VDVDEATEEEEASFGRRVEVQMTERANKEDAGASFSRATKPEQHFVV
jgi:hypothetical protein